MTRADALAMAATIRACYPQSRLTRAHVDAYVAALAPLDASAAARAVTALCRESKFVPSVADICERYSELVVDLPTPDAAWSQVMAALGSSSRTRRPRFECELVGQVVAEMRWYQLCASTNLPAERAAFIRRYRELRDDVVRQIKAGDLLPAPVAGLLEGGCNAD